MRTPTYKIIFKNASLWIYIFETGLGPASKGYILQKFHYHCIKPQAHTIELTKSIKTDTILCSHT